MRATVTLIIINAICFLAAYFLQNSAEYFGLNIFFFNGAYWQILTSMFMHAGIFHIAMNMAVLWQFGTILEKFLGSLRFSLIYLILGILTNILCLAFVYFDFTRGEIINVVGASGAICVLFGIVAFYDPRNAKGLFLMILIISFAPLLLGVNIAWYAHLLGFFLGYFYSFLRNKFGIF